METTKIGAYTITAWAEPSGDKWQGLATVNPAISNTWAGGPTGDSLVVDGLHSTEAEAEAGATAYAVDALASSLGEEALGLPPKPA